MTVVSRILAGCATLALAWAVAAPASAQEVNLPAVNHDLEGRGECLMCHVAGVMEAVPDVPETHENRTNEVCLWCHAPDAAMLTVQPKPTSHAVEGRADCLMCHTAGRMQPVPDVPPDHTDRASEHCLMCHLPPAG